MDANTAPAPPLPRASREGLAVIIGRAFAQASDEEARTAIYETVYRPIVQWLEEGDPSFVALAFSYSCAVAEGEGELALRAMSDDERRHRASTLWPDGWPLAGTQGAV